MPRRRRGRPIDGVLLLDKPAGVTSNAALQTARRLLDARKGGHTGTLDPFATGLLPLCFGEATKFGTGLLEAPKTYRAEAAVGVRTTTGDPEGEAVERADVAVPAAADLETILAAFRGEIEQVPPMYSALKQGGKRLHELARAGQEVERPARRVVIHELALEDRDEGRFTLRVNCSAGTYIRVLVEDIARSFGAPAHTRSLRRLAVGPLVVEDAVTLAELEARAPGERTGLLGPVDAALAGTSRALVDAAGADDFLHGRRPLPTSVGVAPGTLVRVYGPGDFLGVAELGTDGRLVPRRVVDPAVLGRDDGGER